LKPCLEKQHSSLDAQVGSYRIAISKPFKWALQDGAELIKGGVRSVLIGIGFRNNA
jgi:hypothetical protein